MNGQNETETLVESFCTLADEVQNLIDRKTILEHKLRFAAEQYQQLADKYAPKAPEISETLAHLQLPPDQHIPPTPTSYVPLPRRGQVGCNQHQIALLIRDGRRAAQQLVSQARSAMSPSHSQTHSQSQSRPSHINTNTNIGGGSKTALSGTGITTMSTIMELDFTVEGKKGVLDCPFSAMKREQQLQRQKQQLEQENQQLHIVGDDAADDADDAVAAAALPKSATASAPATPGAANSSNLKSNVADANDADQNEDANEADPTPHQSADPICSAMFEESTSQRAPSSGGAARCPIRFLDQHSPEEVANYVEKHKHQLPRSHAICLRRYNKNEEQIRKIDAKYGSLVNMISGLGQFHQPMLVGAAEPGAPGAGDEDPEDTVDRAALHRASHERVKNWADGVASNYDGDVDDDDDDDEEEAVTESNARRESHDDNAHVDNDIERQSHFDRPLKEVRLGESPSRPWGIAVPISSMPHAETQPPLSPPAAPVRMPSPMRAAASPVKTDKKAVQAPSAAPAEPVRKCPFDHTKFGMGVGPPPGHAPVDIPNKEEEDDEEDKAPSSAHPMAAQTERPPTPVKDSAFQDDPEQQYPSVFNSMPQLSQTTQIPSSAGGPAFVPPKPYTQPQYTQPQYTQYAQYPQHQPQPTFLNLPPKPADTKSAPNMANMPNVTGPGAAGAPPQMVFTGPVFIGYPMEQAIQFMQHFQGMNMGQGGR